jgi:hypothetical protein
MWYGYVLKTVFLQNLVWNSIHWTKPKQMFCEVQKQSLKVEIHILIYTAYSYTSTSLMPGCFMSQYSNFSKRIFNLLKKKTLKSSFSESLSAPYIVIYDTHHGKSMQIRLYLDSVSDQWENPILSPSNILVHQGQNNRIWTTQTVWDSELWARRWA